MQHFTKRPDGRSSDHEFQPDYGQFTRVEVLFSGFWSVSCDVIFRAQLIVYLLFILLASAVCLRRCHHVKTTRSVSCGYTHVIRRMRVSGADVFGRHIKYGK